MAKKTRNGETFITIEGYQKFWLYDRDYGHDIVIACDKGKTTIRCKWPDRKRVVSGRVVNK